MSFNINATGITRPFNPAFWQDRYIRTLDQNTKDVYLFLITSHKVNISGIYEITAEEIARCALTDVTRTDDVYLTLDKLKNDEKILYDDGWVFLLNRMKHQSLNPNMIKGSLSQLDELQGLVPESFLKDVETLREGLLKGLGNGSGKAIAIARARVRARANTSSSYDDGLFDRFWKLYPKKTHKQDAIKAWQKNAKVIESNIDAIVTFLKEAIKSESWSDTKYIPNPATFLNGKRWEDDVKLYGRKKKSDPIR